MKKNLQNRRRFLLSSSGLLAGLGLGLTQSATASNVEGPDLHRMQASIPSLPDNPLVLFDNFHVGNRRSYSWKAKFAAAQAAGFDGFEFAMADPDKDYWQEAMDLVPDTNFSTWGFHWSTKAVIDRVAPRIEEEIEKIISNVEVCAKLPIKPYMTLSLSGNGELRGPTVHESGSAKAEDRHWQRAYKIIRAFDQACKKNGVKGSLYPHIHWICDTPASSQKILAGADASHIGPAFCSHHWYGNRNAAELPEVLQMPFMKNLNYVVLTNGHFRSDGFKAVRFDEGDIDMAWVLAQLYRFGYEGPISTQGWQIGGDPYLACKRMVDGIRALRKRFVEQPELFPLN